MNFIEFHSFCKTALIIEHNNLTLPVASAHDVESSSSPSSCEEQIFSLPECLSTLFFFSPNFSKPFGMFNTTSLSDSSLVDDFFWLLTLVEETVVGDSFFWVMAVVVVDGEDLKVAFLAGVGAFFRVTEGVDPFFEDI